MEPGNRLHRSVPGWQASGLQYAQDLKLRGRRIGIIALGQLPGDKHFSSEDVDLLSALSGYAAIALENANLYRSVETKAHELERLKIYTENIIESINVAVLALDLNGNVTSCNRAFEELYRVRRDQVRGMGSRYAAGARRHRVDAQRVRQQRLGSEIGREYLQAVPGKPAAARS